MFTGSYSNTVDEKGRVLIPSKLRYSLGERVWLVKGVDGCLNIFTQEDWHGFASKYITNRTLKDEKSRLLRRFVFSGSSELEIDRQGRINLPQDLMGFAGIEKKVVFAGCGDLVELWSAERYEQEMDPGNMDPKELMRDAAEIVDEE